VISHLVLFKFKPGIGAGDERVERAVAGMRQLPTRIALIRAWEHGFNVTPDEQAWDYGLRATFSSTADLHTYFEHDDHVAVLRQWEEVGDLIFCDFQLP
jgi:hypothetical protein